MKGYTAGQTIQTYTGEGYAAYQAVDGQTADVLVNQNVTGVGTCPAWSRPRPAAPTSISPRRICSATATCCRSDPEHRAWHPAGVTLHKSRNAGIVAVRMDMDQSQFPLTCRRPAGGPGIYDMLIPILQQWKAAVQLRRVLLYQYRRQSEPRHD